MKILTPVGYVNIEDLSVGDKVLAYDIFTGQPIKNELLDKVKLDTSIPEFTGVFYRINGTWDLYEEQSVWRNNDVVFHAKQLEIGDIIFDENDNDVEIITIEKITKDSWWKLHISGDHSYIADGLTLHNASRFWVGGTGTWDNSTTTNWAASSGGAGGASVPGVNDTVTIDASSGTGTITVNTDFNITSLTCGAMGAGVGTPMTLDFSANNNSPTMSTFSGTGTGFRTINMGSGTWTLNGNNTTIWTTSTTTNLTLNAGTSTIVCNYSGSTGTRTIVTGGSSAFGINNLNVTAGTDILTISSTFFINGNLDFTGFTGAWASNTGSIAGNLTCGAGMTTNAGNSTITFTATSSKTITTNGVALQRSFTFNGVGGTWTLQDSLNLSVTASIITLTNGTFNANNFNVTCGTFTSSNSNTRVLSMGSGTWTLTGNNTSIWNTGTTTGLTVSGSANIVCNYSGSVGTRTISPGGLTAFSNNSGTLEITAGTDTVSLTGTSTDFRSIDLTGFSGTLTGAGTTINIRNSLTLSTGMTMSVTAAFNFAGTSGGGTITSNGKSFASNITFNQSGATWILGDDIRTGSSNTLTLTAGTFDTNNKNVTCGLFSSSNTNTRTLNMGSGTWTLTGNAATIFNVGTATNLTFSGTSCTINCTYSGSTGTRTISGGGATTVFGTIKFSAGSDTFVISSSTQLDNLDLTGFTGTWGTGTNSLTVSGNLTFGSGMVSPTGTGVITMSSTSGTKTITSNGVTVNRPITFNGVGGAWQFADTYTGGSTSTSIFTLTNGTLNANNQNISVFAFSSSNSNTRTLTMGNGIWTLTGTGTVWTTSTSTNLFLNPDGSTIVINDTSATGKTFAGGGLTYYNATWSGDNITVSGANTFNGWALNNAGLTNGLLLTAGTTQTLQTPSAFTNNGTAGNLTKLVSTSAGSAATISIASGIISNLDYMSIKDSTATGGATFYAGRNSTNVSGNTGWFFYNSQFTGQAVRDENRVSAQLSVNSRDGLTIIPLYANSTIINNGNSLVTTMYRLVVSDASTGSDLGPNDAKRDENYVPSIMAVSSDDGVTPVAVYSDINTNALLVKSN